jgi:tetratricopeptide (TPR) repeat protein
MLKNYKTFLRPALSMVLLTAIPMLGSVSLTGCEQGTQTPTTGDAKPDSISTAATPAAPAQPSGAKPNGPKLDAKEVAQYQSLYAKAADLEKQKKIADAIPLVKQAIDIKKKGTPDEELGQFYGNLAWAFLTTKKYNEAVDAYTQGLKYVKTGSELAKDFARDRDYASRQFVLAHPEKSKAGDQAQAFSTAGFDAAKSKDFNKAASQFQKAIDVSKDVVVGDDLAQLYANLGWGYSGAKNWSKAVDAYTKALDVASPSCANRKFYERDRGYAQSQIKAPAKK